METSKNAATAGSTLLETISNFSKSKPNSNRLAELLINPPVQITEGH
jgi:hypothetical protein